MSELSMIRLWRIIRCAELQAGIFPVILNEGYLSLLGKNEQDQDQEQEQEQIQEPPQKSNCISLCYSRRGESIK
jgi:hypothetical protein